MNILMMKKKNVDQLIKSKTKFLIARRKIEYEGKTLLDDDILYYVGQKVICNINEKPIVYNSKMYYITDIINKSLIISEKENGNPVTMKKKIIDAEGKKSFKKIIFRCSPQIVDPTYAMTIFKSQGKTISDDYNIFELDARSISINEVYTGLSRGEYLDKIHFNYHPNVFRTLVEPTKPIEIKHTKASIGYIYEMHNPQTNYFYIGQTTTIRRMTLSTNMVMLKTGE
jgi:hypothetical protein